MNSEVKRKPTYWWTPILFGVIFILTGVWILRSPMESYEQLTRIIGVIILLSGATQIFLAIENRKEYQRWGFQAFSGPIDLIIGVILILKPDILLRIITLFVGIWLLVNGFFMIIRAVKARKAKLVRWKWELGMGILLLVLSGLFIWHPIFIGITIAIWSALAFILLGIFRIALTLRVRKQARDQAEPAKQ